eukprot:CAMPEP_0168621424 /NCGR_PEP_ID=MMETSP0449_2-20121227/7684_1 /TAXON_ID=1082188 /ORGANISM="Strombidium rassoulzadegani, Strain ras09" /LENGTH=123 /DNA_ID=CAMNT_0008662537 /DNA_START=160 /DNA_END=526 /DNA_ORIENTATION=-
MYLALASSSIKLKARSAFDTTPLGVVEVGDDKLDEAEEEGHEAADPRVEHQENGGEGTDVGLGSHDDLRYLGHLVQVIADLHEILGEEVGVQGAPHHFSVDLDVDLHELEELADSVLESEGIG